MVVFVEILGFFGHFNKISLNLSNFGYMSMLMTHIESLANQQREITSFLHSWLTMEHNLEAKYRFKIPFYYQNTWICYLNPIKNDGIEFNFVRARELSLHEDVLDFKGRKMVAGISLYDVKKIPLDKLGLVLEEALILDETTPYTFKKRKKKI